MARLRAARPGDAARLIAEIASHDGDITQRLEAEWSRSRFADDRWKRERLPLLTPYDQLLMRMQQAAAYSAVLADPHRLLRLLGVLAD